MAVISNGISKETKKIVQEVYSASIPGTIHQVFSAIRVSEDTLSLTRNILCAVPMVGPRIASHLGYYVGIVSAFFSFQALSKGFSDYQRSAMIGDSEGKRRFGFSVLSAGIASVGSVSYLAGKVFDTFSLNLPVMGAFGATDAFLGLGTFIALGSSIWGAARCAYFSRLLNQQSSPEKALQFLKEAISVTEEERNALRAQIEKEHPSWSEKERGDFLGQEIIKKTEVKVKYVKRRTSCKSIHLIAHLVDGLLAKLADQATRADGLKETAAFLQTIRGEIKAKTALYLATFLAGLISLAGLAVSTFLTAGVLSFVLYGIAGTIYLVTAVYNAVITRKKSYPDNNVTLRNYSAIPKLNVSY